MLESVKQSMIETYKKELDLFFDRYLKYPLEEKLIKLMYLMNSHKFVINFVDHRGPFKTKDCNNFYINITFDDPSQKNVRVFNISSHQDSIELCLNYIFRETVATMKKNIDHLFYEPKFIEALESLVK